MHLSKRFLWASDIYRSFHHHFNIRTQQFENWPISLAVKAKQILVAHALFVQPPNLDTFKLQPETLMYAKCRNSFWSKAQVDRRKQWVSQQVITISRIWLPRHDYMVLIWGYKDKSGLLNLVRVLTILFNCISLTRLGDIREENHSCVWKKGHFPLGFAGTIIKLFW